MRRFLLFTGCEYYPCGGWDDFSGDFNSLMDAREYFYDKLTVKKTCCGREQPDWAHILDFERCRVVLKIRKENGSYVEE